VFDEKFGGSKVSTVLFYLQMINMDLYPILGCLNPKSQKTMFPNREMFSIFEKKIG
jgi:hypothetical protein